MIPELKREHIEMSLRRIDAEGVPFGRGSRKFFLVAHGRKYPPKYVLSLASFYAYGRELRPEEFGGGRETNSCLQRLLEQIAVIWPRGQRVTFLMTPGAFITFGRPDALPRVSDNVNQDYNPAIVSSHNPEICVSDSGGKT